MTELLADHMVQRAHEREQQVLAQNLALTSGSAGTIGDVGTWTVSSSPSATYSAVADVT